MPFRISTISLFKIRIVDMVLFEKCKFNEGREGDVESILHWLRKSYVNSSVLEKLSDTWLPLCNKGGMLE